MVNRGTAAAVPGAPAREAAAPTAPVFDPGLAEAARAFEQEIGPLTKTIADHLAGWVAEVDPALVVAVIRDAALHGKRSAKYVDSIIRAKKAEHIVTLAAYQASQAAFAAKKQARGGAPPEEPDPYGGREVFW